MVELERKALMGDKEAQEECTRRRIVLRCPRCGETPVAKAFVGAGMFYFECNCGSETHCFDSKQKALLEWNTRSAPPVGRCGECKHLDNTGTKPVCWHTGLPLKSENDFCSYFEPKGDEENGSD